jgi:hypothetical protein
MRSLLLRQDPEALALQTRYQEAAEALGGDVTDLDAIMAPLWEARDVQIAHKVDATVWVCREFAAMAKARLDAAEQLRVAAERCLEAEKRIKAYLLRTMAESGVTKLEGITCQVTMAKNGGVLPLKIDVPVEQLPAHVTRTITRVEPDKEAIRTTLDHGGTVPGCTLGERGERLVIR